MTRGAELTCERDRTATRLTCVQCGTPICPQCFVRTPVGLKCPKCGAGATSARTSSGRGVGAKWALPVALAVLLLSIFAVPRIFSSDDDSTSNPISDTVPPNLGVANPEMRVRYARIGQEARDGDLAFTVQALDCGATEVGGGGSVRVAQGRFCFVDLDVKNFGRSPATFLGRLQMVLDGQSRRFGPDPTATQAHPGNEGRDLTSVVVNPGNELKGVLVFDVPDGVVPVVAALRVSTSGPGTHVNLERRPS